MNGLARIKLRDSLLIRNCPSNHFAFVHFTISFRRLLLNFTIFLLRCDWKLENFSVSFDHATSSCVGIDNTSNNALAFLVFFLSLRRLCFAVHESDGYREVVIGIVWCCRRLLNENCRSTRAWIANSTNILAFTLVMLLLLFPSMFLV